MVRACLYYIKAELRYSLRGKSKKLLECNIKGVQSWKQLPSRMNVADRLWLMMKMLKENYDSELYRQQRLRIGTRPRSLTPEEMQLCRAEARKAVCETGISMYRYSKHLKTRYNRTIETEAIHQAVELGISNKLLQLSQPRRYDVEKGSVGQNIALTEKGFEAIFETGTERVMTIIHSIYIPKLGR
jgi:hypothetical protein